VLSLVAWLFSIPVSMIFIHFFESILEVKISLSYLNVSLAAGFFVSLLVVGIISGIYPAIMTSSIAPSITGGKTNISHHSQGRWKNAFVLYQFVLSISLTIACLVIIKQTNFLKSFEVGYEKDNIIQIMLPREKVQEFQSLRNNLMANPDIVEICFAGASPVNLSPINSTENWTWKGLGEGTHTSIYPIYGDHNYLKIFQIPLIEGRYFSSSGTNQDKVVINERLAGLMGFSDPIGQILTRGENQYEIIGMVKDFHFQHLSNDIHPLIFMYSDSKPKMFIKTNIQSKELLEQIQNIFLNFSDEPYNYDFVTDQYDELYKDELMLTIAILVFTILTIILSCIGLIGLITFSTETRTKEIGIRKVCGASTGEMLKLLNIAVIRWFLLGFVLSCVLSWIGLNRWLERFANRITLDWSIFILGASIILLITALTVSLQIWRAATRNPAEALRSE
jgi:putative ABC transport system permease protein